MQAKSPSQLIQQALIAFDLSSKELANGVGFSQDDQSLAQQAGKAMHKYVARVRKDPDSDFGVDFPDFPGCITAGSTLDEAREMAEEALEFHIDGMIEDGDAIPEPTPIETILDDPENQDVATVFLVEATPGRPHRPPTRRAAGSGG